jgi:peptidoglycan/xylan/chitin deacetylase (PgdA/CDA1 family)
MPTLLLSFDNLGEASELERGTWDANVPLGSHPSVTIALPRLLGALDRLELKATFFIESVNCEINPDAVLQIAARGHELGVHGWRHETWSTLSTEDERALLDDGLAAFAALGIRPRGFRPPGGELTASSMELLRERGFTWCSPAGEPDEAERDAGAPGPGAYDQSSDRPAVLPFRWEMVDTYYLMERFAALRVARGEGSEPVDPALAALRIEAGLMDGPDYRALILHPFMMLDDEWWMQTRRLLRLIAETSRMGRLTVGTGRQLLVS